MALLLQFIDEQAALARTNEYICNSSIHEAVAEICELTSPQATKV